MRRCQIPGCKCAQINEDSGNGIYNGVYLEWSFRYCNNHTKHEVKKAEGDFIDKLVKKHSCVNPFVASLGEIHELGKAAG